MSKKDLMKLASEVGCSKGYVENIKNLDKEQLRKTFNYVMFKKECNERVERTINA